VVILREIESRITLGLYFFLRLRNLFGQGAAGLASQHLLTFDVVRNEHLRERIRDALRKFRIRMAVTNDDEIRLFDRKDRFVSDDRIFVWFQLGQLVGSQLPLLQLFFADGFRFGTLSLSWPNGGPFAAEHSLKR